MLRSFILRIFYPERKKIRLRHVLFLGTMLEQQAEEFYRRLARQANDPGVKLLCEELADDEIEHLDLIKGMLSRWQKAPINKSDLEDMGANERLRKLFLSPPGPDATEHEMIEYGIEEEKKMVEFYTDFEKEFPQAWKIMKLREIINEEEKHVKKLSDFL